MTKSEKTLMNTKKNQLFTMTKNLLNTLNIDSTKAAWDIAHAYNLISCTKIQLIKVFLTYLPIKTY